MSVTTWSVAGQNFVGKGASSGEPGVVVIGDSDMASPEVDEVPRRQCCDPGDFRVLLKAKARWHRRAR